MNSSFIEMRPLYEFLIYRDDHLRRSISVNQFIGANISFERLSSKII